MLCPPPPLPPFFSLSFSPHFELAHSSSSSLEGAPDIEALFTAKELAFGNEETGSPIAAESIMTEDMIMALGSISLLPTWATTGMMMIAATVDEMKFATMAIKTEKAPMKVQSPASPRLLTIDSDAMCSRYDLSITCPRASPPPMRISTVQLRPFSKSSRSSRPVLKKRITGTSATTPIDPKIGSSCRGFHSAHASTVKTVMMMASHWDPFSAGC
mmetsp:Transcript_4665/g.11773  ORF Transcript_4665/g.11773 Transcript_4665/m.11773 type:complete len:215 (-) Transcript_4665:1096-1740(-)